VRSSRRPTGSPRHKQSDGTIGDKNHDPPSDHCPDSRGVVHALDVTHDPARGLDCEEVAGAIRARKDSRVKYIIFKRRIMAGSEGPSPWKWRKFKKAPHDKHMHISIKHTAAAENDVRSWLGGTPLMAAVVPVKGWDEVATKEEIKAAVREVLRDELRTIISGDPGTQDGGTHPHNLRNIHVTVDEIKDKLPD
jgi:hypothetical protein